MRFLCDEMLARLARLLRAAGHDAYLAADGQPDAELLEIARAEGRIVLTRDRALAQAAAPASVLIAGRGVEAEAASLAAQVEMDWTFAPFTRCVMDNAVLREASREEIAAMPLQARTKGGPFRACPACGRLYWPGSHVQRMAARLHALAGVDPPSASA